MPDTLEDLYLQIGQTIAGIIPEEWESARVNAEIKPGVITIKGYYYATADGKEHSMWVNRQLVTLFSQLHAQMVAELHDDWKTAKAQAE